MSTRAGIVAMVLFFCVLCASFGRDEFTIWVGLIGTALSLIVGTVIIAVDQRRSQQADDAGY